MVRGTNQYWLTVPGTTVSADSHENLSPLNENTKERVCRVIMSNSNGTNKSMWWNGVRDLTVLQIG